MRTWQRSAVLAVASGTAMGLALGVGSPPMEAWVLAFVGPGLLLASIEAGPTLPGPGRAFLYGALTGFVADVLGLYWTPKLLEGFAGFPAEAAVPCALLLWIAQSLPFAFAAAATTTLGKRGVPTWLMLPVTLTLAFTVTPLLFPWRPSMLLIRWLSWVQLADVGGTPLLDLLLLLASCALVRAAWPSLPWKKRLLPLAVAAATIAGPVVYGTVRLPEVRAERARAPELRVGVVQPDIGARERFDTYLWPEQLFVLQRMTRRLEAHGAQLVVWPETAYPFPFFRQRWTDPPGPRKVLADGVRGPLLFGAVTQSSMCDRWNSVLAMAANGRVVGRADKVHLLTFGETVPLWHWLPPLQKLFQCPGLKAGRSPEIVHIAGVRIAVLNCYEDVLGAYARQLARLDPALLVNVTNDVWFGHSSEPWLHDEVARLRSIETRRDLVRAVNTGVSGHVLATGAQVERTGTFDRASFIADVHLLHGTTFWVRWGDLTSAALGGALLGIVLALARRSC